MNQDAPPPPFPVFNIAPIQLPPVANIPNQPAPDWDRVGEAFGILSEETPHIANGNPYAQMAALTDGINALIQGFNGLANALGPQFATIQQTLDLMPMRIANASSSINAPLVYPIGHAAGGNLPLTKLDALRLNGVEAAAALQVLGVPNIPVAAHAQILLLHTYLGIV